LAKHLLSEIHRHYKKENYPFSILMGEPEIYKSSGYSSVKNVYLFEHDEKPARHPMIHELQSDVKWHDDNEKIVLNCPSF
jgi:predicted acetyltransferase